MKWGAICILEGLLKPTHSYTKIAKNTPENPCTYPYTVTVGVPPPGSSPFGGTNMYPLLKDKQVTLIEGQTGNPY